MLFLSACAKRGTPSGGEKDTSPPVIVKADPPLGSTNFKGDRIRIYFDEYIKFKGVEEQFLVSPPMKIPPVLSPQLSPSKYLEIELKDTLLPNTTYSFYFGNSVVDNNEENPYPYLNYVMATGDRIDSLNLKGMVKDAQLRKAEPFINVVLYPNDSTYNDSIIYNSTPRYLTSTLDSLPTFELNFLSKGSYYLYALKDENKNNKYDPYLDKLAFLKKPITLPTDSLFLLELFKEKIKFKAERPKFTGSNHITFGYQSDLDSLPEIRLLSVVDSLWSFTEKVADKDSLNFWFRAPSKIDSLRFRVAGANSIDTFTVKPVGGLAKDTLTFAMRSKSSLAPNQPVFFRSSTPLKAIDTSLIAFVESDSIKLPALLKMQADARTLTLDFNPKPEGSYKLSMLPGAIQDYFQQTNDSLSFRFNMTPVEDFGTLKFELENAKPKDYPMIIELLDKNDKSPQSLYLEAAGNALFQYVEPGTYSVRITIDTNGNRRFDTGNYLLKRDPERIIYVPETIEVRANWEERLRFRLLD
ncbi:MAG: Ig-like domain-containing protein [Flavobacteriaceae bacterium]